MMDTSTWHVPGWWKQGEATVEGPAQTADKEGFSSKILLKSGRRLWEFLSEQPIWETFLASHGNQTVELR
jgi:hypothetical protein